MSESTNQGGLPRLVEGFLAASGLVLLSPVMALCSLAVLLTTGSPILFRQIRVGRGGRPFTLVKFRTMRAAGGGPEVTASGDARITPVGRFLRRWKLDELPELWNVVLGEMSLVGPRPEVPAYVDPEAPAWREVLDARPGLTDPTTLALRDEEALLASIAGDRELFYRESLQPRKLEGYRQYLRRRTWRSDLGVLFRTVAAILFPARAPAGPRQAAGRH
ncbi:MAG TPA: sugar transferase [Thermoanaerobaculia bacterium]|nr:sugar transferase [Thermoanaerobaculia bacterium]